MYLRYDCLFSKINCRYTSVQTLHSRTEKSITIFHKISFSRLPVHCSRLYYWKYSLRLVGGQIIASNLVIDRRGLQFHLETMNNFCFLCFYSRFLVQMIVTQISTLYIVGVQDCCLQSHYIQVFHRLFIINVKMKTVKEKKKSLSYYGKFYFRNIDLRKIKVIPVYFYAM